MGFFAELGLRLPIFDRAGLGTVGTTQIDDVSGRIDTYDHTISATVGFESMSCGFPCTVSEAQYWLSNGLLWHTIVSSPDADTAWEGYLSEIVATFGRRQRSVSLDGMANRVRVRYTTVLDTPGVSSAVSDSLSINKYGTKDHVEGLNKSTATAAANAAAQLLAAMKNPRMTPTTQIATGELGEVRLDLNFSGWYTTLDWVLTSRSSTTATDTGTQIGDLVQASGAGIGATNGYLSTSRNYISTTGISDTEYIEQDTPYRAKLEALAAQGDGSERWVLMCLEGRALRFHQWAGADLTIIAYRSSLASHEVYDANGGWVPPWSVRPDAMYEEQDLLDPSPVTTQQDAAARQYAERVHCFVGSDGFGCDIEPQASDNVTTMLARLMR